MTPRPSLTLPRSLDAADTPASRMWARVDAMLAEVDARLRQWARPTLRIAPDQRDDR